MCLGDVCATTQTTPMKQTTLTTPGTNSTHPSTQTTSPATYPPTTASNETPASGSHTGMIVTIIVIVLVFILAAIGFGYYRIKKK